MRREWEFVGGSIRLKVAIINRSAGLLADVRLRPVFAEESFALERVEPATVTLTAGEARLGNIDPGEKRTCAVYLDPLICSTGNIEGIVLYRDARGKLQTVPVPPLKVPVACPIFFTADTASVATVRNLVENVLEKRDSRVYLLPSVLEPQQALEIMREIVQMHSVRHIRDFIEPSPWTGESWYYGTTKDGGRPFVIVTRAFADSRTLTFTTHAESEQNICGLLADLHSQLNAKLQDARYIAQPLTQVTNVTIRDSVIHRSTLLLGGAVAGDAASRQTG